MKLLKRLSAFLMLTALSLLVACGGEAPPSQEAPPIPKGEALERIKNQGVLRIGVYGDRAPFGYVDENGLHRGFDIEIARNFGKSLLGSEDKIEFVTLVVSDRIPALQQDKVDIVLALFTRTDERAKLVNFAEPYLNVSLGIVSHAAAPVFDVSELKGKTLIVTRGTTAEEFFAKLHPEVKLLRFENNAESFLALREGRGAALAHDNVVLWAWVQTNREFTVGVGKVGPVDNIAPAVRKGEGALLEWVNAEIAKMKLDGRLIVAYERALRPIYGFSVHHEDILAK